MVFAGLGAFLLAHPRTPLRDHWNPVRPLDLAAPVTVVTRWKLPGTQDGPACLAALRSGRVAFTPLEDLEPSDHCHIRDRVLLRGLDGTEIHPVETRCATALRLALWVRHGLEPAAREVFGAGLARIHHLSSYNCRPVRTPDGTSTRMSTHSTADAIDVSGVTLDDGTRITLLKDWNKGRPGLFLTKARDASCTWFETTLGPEYNDLHADHFHLQTRGWGLCR